VTKISVVLVDDHTVVREAVRLMLEAEPDMAIVGEASDGDAGIATIARLRPDVAIVDLAMPGLPGLAVVRELGKATPRTAVLVFTTHKATAYVIEAMRAGARGFVLKSARREELVAAIRAVHGGGGFLQPEIAGPVLRRMAADARADGAKSDLTAREIQILEGVADGHSNKEIGVVLAIAEDTVKTHLRRLFEKLGAQDRAQAVAIALRQHLIE
jgi:DNA-binding NarL/FixJ family response regulator